MAISADNRTRLIILPILFLASLAGIIYIIYLTEIYENPYEKAICTINNTTIVKNCYGHECYYQGFITIQYQSPMMTLINIMAVAKEKTQEKILAKMSKYLTDTEITCYYPKYYYDSIRLEKYDATGYYVFNYFLVTFLVLLEILFVRALVITIRESHQQYHADNNNPHVRLP